MKSMAIVACAAVGLWSCTAAAAAEHDENSPRARAVQSPSLEEMTQVVEAQEHLTSAAYDLIGWLASGGTMFDSSGSSNTDDDQTVQGRGKKPKPAMMAMTMLGTAAMSTMMMKSMGAIMMFIIHSFFATKLGLILAAYLLLCKLSEMKNAPAKKVIKWSPPPPPPSSYDEQPPQMIMSGGPYPDSQQSSYADPLQQDLLQQQPPPQQQQPSGQYGAPAPQQQYGAPALQQQYMAPGDFGGGGGGDFMQGHYSNVSPVTYRPPINKLPVVDNAAKSAKAGRL